MTAEVFTTQNHGKYIPILARGGWEDVAPSWLAGTYYVDLSDPARFERQYEDLHSTIADERPSAPQLGPIPQSRTSARPQNAPIPPTATTDQLRLLGLSWTRLRNLDGWHAQFLIIFYSVQAIPPTFRRSGVRFFYTSGIIRGSLPPCTDQ